jgi:hypothetical protein
MEKTLVDFSECSFSLSVLPLGCYNQGFYQQDGIYSLFQLPEILTFYSTLPSGHLIDIGCFLNNAHRIS